MGSHLHIDKAGKEYWDSVWQGESIPDAVNPRDPSFHNYVNRAFHQLWLSIFGKYPAPGPRLLEIGCARSVWLPYFSKEFGFSVAGIDYSELGCAQARAVLDKAGVDGEVVCANFFAPPANMLGIYDVLISFGVVEHFDDTTDCLRSLMEFLKPGGLIITVIPNLTGAIGYVEKLLARSIYDVHVPLGRRALCEAHARAGFKVFLCKYFLSVNWGVLNFTSWKNQKLRYFVGGVQTRLSWAVWALEGRGLSIKPNKLTSPYIVCVGRKP